MEEKKKPGAKRPATRAGAKPTHASRQPVEAKPEAAPIVSQSNVMPSTEAKKSATPRDRRGWWVIGGTIVGLVVLFLLVFGVLIYKYKSDSRMVQIVAGIVPYPAESVNGHWVSYSDYLFEVNSIKHYYLSQTTANGKAAINFTTADGKQKLKQLEGQVVTELQQEAVVKQLASQRHISVTSTEVNAQVNQITKSAGGQDKVKDVLKKFYGWDINDLKKKIKFQLLEQKVTTAVQNDSTLNAAAMAKANDVLKQVKSGTDFGTLAKKYSQDSSAANGGDLGFVTKSQLPATFATTAFGLQPGQTSGVVKTQYGYSIIKTIEFNSDHSQAHVAQILIKSTDFSQYLTQQVGKAKVHVYVHP